MKTKKITLLQVALTFAGSFLGAGFVSGQELYVYFGSYGKIGIPSMIISIALLGLASYIVFSLCMDKGIRTPDDLIVRSDIPWLKGVCAVLINILTVFVDCVMTAGIAALFYRIFGLPVRIGTIIVLIISGAIAYFGVTGMIKTFSLLVPFLIVFAIIISVVYIAGADASAAVFTAEKSSPLLGSWEFSAINYCTFSIMSVIGVHTAFSSQIKNKSTAIWGIVLGSTGMIFIGTCIVFAMYLSPEAVKAELPMLDIAFTLGKPVGLLYAVLLFFGMFGNTVASKVAILNYFELKMPALNKHRLLMVIVMSVVVFLSSSMGFSAMVKIFDPIFGYVGYAVCLLICEHKIHYLLHEKAGKQKNGKPE